MAKIVFLVLVVILESDCVKINLALNKRAHLSSVNQDHFARYAVDGEIYSNYAIAHKTSGGAWFVVDLGRPYQVEQVVLYHRSHCYDCFDGMDHFSVGLLNDFNPKIQKAWRDHYTVCEISNKTLQPAEVVRLICRETRELFRYVMVHKEKEMYDLVLREFEVFGNYINHIGCFKELVNSILIGSNMDLVDCIHACKKYNESFAGVEESMKCFCGVRPKHFRPLRECSSICLNSSYPCGGENVLSAYEIFPLNLGRGVKRKYVGCYADHRDNRDLIFGLRTERLTHELCQQYCAERDYFFFGVQYEEECFCGNNYGKYNIEEEKFCDMDCKGNHYQICGGGHRNSIYLIQNGWNFFNFCKDGVNLDLDGICENKQCRDGWTGDSCSMRDCSTNNGDCGIHKCQQASILSEEVSECLCNPGYDKTSWWEYCQDIDECKEGDGICNKIISTCKNTEGSFECQCFIGYEAIDDVTCQDTDECHPSNNKCNLSTTTCINRAGSFECRCKNGFNNLKDYACMDIDECQDTNDACNAKVANCKNTLGSYNCQCIKNGLIYDMTNRVCYESSTQNIIVVVICVSVGVILLITIIFVIYVRKIKKKRNRNAYIYAYVAKDTADNYETLDWSTSAGKASVPLSEIETESTNHCYISVLE